MLSKRISAFIVDCRAAGLAPKSIKWYENMLEAWKNWVGDRDWTDPNITREFIADLQSRSMRYTDHPRHPSQPGPLSPFTVRGYVRAIKRFFNWLVQEEVLPDNPLKNLRMPKKPQRIPRAIESDDFDKMLAVAHTKRDRAILLVLRDTGCRVSELCNMKVTNIDLDRGIGLVRNGKGAQDRFIFFSPITRQALRDWLSEKPSSEWLFVQQTCHKTQPVPVKPLKPSGVHGILKRIAKRAEVTHRHNAHSLRHGFARDYLLNGGDLGSLSDILGHHDLETTRAYAVFLVDHLKALHQQHSPVAHLELPQTS